MVSAQGSEKLEVMVERPWALTQDTMIYILDVKKAMGSYQGDHGKLL